MTWASHKSLVLAPEVTSLTLDAKPLQVVSSATHLGSTISTLGVKDKAIQDRIKASRNLLKTWQSQESKALRLHRSSKLTLVKKFFLPSVDFGTHIAEISPETRHAT